MAAPAAVASVPRTRAETFVAARAAATAGDPRRAALLYASLAAADPKDRVLPGRALGQAILAGDMAHALRLARALPPADLSPDARLLLAAEALRTRRDLARPWPTELAFIEPFIRAWSRSDRGDWRGAGEALAAVPADSLLGTSVGEHQALILLAAGRIDEARPLVAPAIRRAGGRADRLRIAFAAGYLRAGRRDEGLALLDRSDPTQAAAAAQLAAMRRPDLPVATAAQGLSQLLTGLAIGLDRAESQTLPLALAQVARFADPANDQAVILLGLLLGNADRGDHALAVLRAVPEASPFLSEARDAEIRILLRAERREEALARAQAFVAVPRPTVGDWSRLGDVFDAMDRHGEAAAAFERALAQSAAGDATAERWSLHLLHGAALEQAGRWPEAERALEAAHALAPANPVVLNYLGYARLERGEQLDEAEALIAEASRRAPEDASITDSLGWAQFKRGRTAEAIVTLGRAAAADPAQAEIHEHLGDALYTAGRRYEARFAWNAALIGAEDEVAKRVGAKIAGGLTPATAAP